MEELGIILPCIFAVLFLIALLIAVRKLMNRHRSSDRKEAPETETHQHFYPKHELTQSYQQSRPGFTIERGITVTIIRGDITNEDVDVIVNAANGRLQHGGGVARAIAMKAGDGINQEGQRELSYRRGRELKVSEVLHTGGYNLKAKYVIHAVGPIRGKDSPFSFLLKKTFLNCLEYADEKLEAKSIAMPLISSGIFGGSKEECAETLVHAVNEFAQNYNFKKVNEIRLVNIDAEATQAIDTIFSIELERIKQK